MSLANGARFLIMVSSFYLIGLCVWHARKVVAASVRNRIIGLGLMAVGLVVNGVQRWDESFPLAFFLLFPGVVIAIHGMSVYRPNDIQDGPESRSKPL